MKQQVQVVMLPTETQAISKGNIILPIKNTPYNKEKVLETSGAEENFLDMRLQPQHLYFIFNEQTKKGNWVITKDNIIFKAKVDGLLLEYYRKIVATTDPSLGLPVIPQSFIEEYVKSNGSIKSIWLETVVDDPPDQQQWQEMDKEEKSSWLKPYVKLTSNNEVIIISQESNKSDLSDSMKALNPHDWEDYKDNEERCNKTDKEIVQQKIMDTTKNFGIQLEDPNKELNDAVKKWVTINSGVRLMLTPEFVRESFKEGAKWMQEQSTNDAIEFGKWLETETNPYFSKERMRVFIDRDKDDFIPMSYSQLYELWKNRNR